MKILMAAMSMGLGGAETHVLELSRALAARGHEVFVASSGGVYAEELAKYGVKHEKIPLDSKKTAAKAAFLLARLMESERFDLVHAHARIPAFVCGKLKPRFGFAFVTTVHFDFRTDPILRRISDWGERTFAVSEDIAESAAKKYGLERGRITVVNNGIDTARFSPANSGEGVRKRFGLGGKKVIMYLGRLDGDSFLPAKVLLDAAEDICRGQSDARVLIVGEGEKREQLEKSARALNEKLGFELAVFAGGTAKPWEYFAACDVFVGPSRSAMEALASCKPAVLAGNFGMLGIFSPQTASEALRTNFCCRGSEQATGARVCEEVLHLLACTEAEKAQIAAYGRAFIEKHYSTDRMADVCEREYLSLLEKKGKKAVICGYYGAGNAGDEAMLGVLLAMLKSCKFVKKITVISANPSKTAACFGVSSVYKGDLRAISRELAEGDALIFGGGNILQDKTSTRSLAYYANLAELAKKHACKVLFSANGIGPITRGNNTELAKKALLCADYISMREEASLVLAKKLTGRGEVYASGELAFLHANAASPRARGGYFVVFPKFTAGFRFAELIKFCTVLKRKYGLAPVFAPMHAGEDAELCRRLASRTAGAVSVNAESMRALSALIGGADITFCMRFHAAVFSVSAGVPAISVSDDAKIKSFFGRTVACLPLCASAETLFSAAEEALCKRESAKKLLGEFAGEQRRLALAECRRLCSFLEV